MTYETNRVERRLKTWTGALLFACMQLLGADAFAVADTSAQAALDNEVKAVRLGRGVEYLLEKPGEPLTREQAMASSNAARWQRHEGSKISLGTQAAPVWLRFVISNKSESSHWALNFEYPLLRNLDVYQLDGEGKQLQKQLRIDVEQRDPQLVMKDPNHLLPLDIQPGQSAVMLVRVDTDVYTLPMSLWERDTLKNNRVDAAVSMGALFGILVAILLVNVGQLIATRNRNLLDYSLYLACVILFEAAATGYGNLYLWSDSSWFKKEALPLLACLMQLTAMVFMRRFLVLRKAPRHINWGSRGLIGFWAVATPLYAVLPRMGMLDGLMFAMGWVQTLFIIGSSFELVIKNNSPARYFLASWSVLALAQLIHMAWGFNAVQGSLWLENAQHIGFVAVTSLLSIALVDRMQRERGKKEAAQLRGLRMARRMKAEHEQRFSEHALAMTLQKEANEALERRVAERTTALEAAMQELEAANADLTQLSTTDGLTKAHNRRHFDEVLSKEFERARRMRTPLTLLMLDIDHFNRINDSVGHMGGDECLKLVAKTLQSTVNRANDLVARYGGEEFALILPTTTPEYAFTVAEKLRSAVESIHFIYGGRRVPISISIGVVSEVPSARKGQAQFVTEVEKALHEAKHAGRNCVKLAANG